MTGTRRARANAVPWYLAMKKEFWNGTENPGRAPSAAVPRPERAELHRVTVFRIAGDVMRGDPRQDAFLAVVVPLADPGAIRIVVAAGAEAAAKCLVWKPWTLLMRGK